MGLPNSPARLAVESLLADGEWHPLYEALAAARLLIRPEMAVRNVKSNDRPGTRPRTMTELVEAGRRRIVANILHQIGCEMRGPKGWEREYRWRLASGCGAGEDERRSAAEA